MSFTIEHVEFYLLVLIRITSFVIGAPFFGYQTIPMKIRLSIGMILSLVAFQTVPVVELHYVGVLGFSVLVLKEMMVGLILGFMCNMCTYIISFAGQLMDMEMGLSMASTFDPLTNIQVSISGNMYLYLVMLMMLISNLHYKIVQAILDTFTYFNVGQAVFDGNLQETAIEFIANFFLVGFRIVLPIFACMLVINVVLGVLSRAIPQMNMFVVGIQIKVLVGIVLLLIIVPTVPTITNFVVETMQEIVVKLYNAFTPT
ncbi:MAG: flagellar biosynthetic protein FliR [Clostridiales bacterium]|nr:flagellar biosynthetic protein FliR [Eubacterium sp.]MDD5994991.1 flagellar biosynthetic protein FliR [Clostridiales bacterium]MDD7349060.1 flagellar biosynthetic protein FliR [Clostridiales bacterium]MDY3775340.1 flagellar biosynthetic protein FliR [Eubacterium sp.]